MKYSSLAAFLFCLAHSVANAQPVQINKPLVCDKTDTVFSVLKEKFQEMPVWGGKNSGDQASYALMLNSETRTWTLVQFNTDTACILGIGNDYVTQKL
jgi:hypothetical protein